MGYASLALFVRHEESERDKSVSYWEMVKYQSEIKLLECHEYVVRGIHNIKKVLHSFDHLIINVFISGQYLRDILLRPLYHQICAFA